MRNGDDGREHDDDDALPPPPPSEAFDGSTLSSDLFASSDFPDTGDAPAKPIPNVHDEPTRNADSPVPGAFVEGTTRVMQLDERMKALAALHSGEDSEPSAPAPTSMHDEPTRVPTGEESFSFGDEATEQIERPQIVRHSGFDPNEPTTQFDMGAFSAPTAETALPAHLQLPSIDFSLPDGVGEPPSSSSSATTSSATTRELPAHLQLPNFPDFDLPAVPGLEQPRRHLAEGVDIEGNLGGSFGAMNSTPSSAKQGTSQADGWAVAPASQAAMPPPRRTAPQHAKRAGPGDLPVLPQMGLPSVGNQQQKREPTLLRADVAEELATVRKKSVMAPVLIILTLLTVAGVAVFLYKDVIIAQVFPKQQQEAEETPTDKARKMVAMGTTFYDQNQMPSAIDAFEKALSLDPTYAKAHRSIGIAYAKMNQPDKAVTHYRSYLALAPTADDAAEVKKIIADYDTKAKEEAAEAQVKAAEAAKAAAEAEKAKRKHR